MTSLIEFSSFRFAVDFASSYSRSNFSQCRSFTLLRFTELELV